MPIKTLGQLRQHLQTAIELEHATIPAYLCALFTLKPETNLDACEVIRSVVVEEMLHMTLAANLLNAIAGQPSINHPNFVPNYPTYLPHSNQAFLVNLMKFSPETLDTFLSIEQPAPLGALPEADHFYTIGQFYEAIEAGFKQLTLEYGEDAFFSGDPRRQITPEYYYAGGGQAMRVHNLETALQALDIIKDQGEGLDHTIWGGDYPIFGEANEVAHYFRFEEIKLGRHYQARDTIRSGPTGSPLKIDWDQVYPMVSNPKTKDYPLGSELQQKSHEFNLAYSHLLNQLHQAFNGQPELLIPAVGRMFDLKYKALALIKNPFPGRAGYHAGPSFEFVSNEVVVKQLNRYFAAGDVVGILSLLSEDVIWELSGPAAIPYAGTFEGYQGFEEFWQNVTETVAFTGGSKKLIAQHNQVVSIGEEEGVVKTTGKSYQYGWVQVYTLDEQHKIKRMVQYFNPLSILDALKGEATMNQQQSGRPLPSIPQGLQMPFYYASLTNCELFFLVDPAVLGPYLENSGVEPALFEGRGVVSFNYQLHTSQFPFGASPVTEVEFNIVAYPQSEAANIPAISFKQFVLGDEQTKLLGNFRVHVACDDEIAINAGKALFGEPKFKTTFSSNLPSLNAPAVETWQFTCNDPSYTKPSDPGCKVNCIFSCEVDLQNLDLVPANPSPITEYSNLNGQLIGARWNILHPFNAYFLRVDQHQRVKITYGDSQHPMRQDMAILIGDRPTAAAVRTFQSPPVAIQSRAYYP